MLLIFTLAACGNKCEHTYDNACDATCNECGEVREVGAHDYAAADCDTAKTCKICGATDGEALGHTAEADDGNCTTDIKCATCGAVVISGKTQHVAHADDGDCTTPVTCTECSIVITAAKSHDFSGAWEKDASGHWHVCKNDCCTVTDTKENHISDGAATEEKAEKCTVCEYVITPELEHTHKHNIPKFDNDNHWIECACGDKSAITAHTANDDDGDCTTAVTCSGCAHIMTVAKAHTPNADDGDCTTDITCKDCGKVTTAGYKEHTPNNDDGDCTTAITCQYCDVVTTEARNEHTGGTATCMQGAICTFCGIEYTEKDSRNHASDNYTYNAGDDTTHAKIHECNAIVSEETHIVSANNNTYTWSENYASCTANGLCSVCESSARETVSSTDQEKYVAAIFTIAGFEEQRFNKTTIFFNTDGGSNIAPIVQLCGTKVTPPADPSKPGFIFVGWDKEIPTTMPSEDVTISATWEVSSYTVIWVDDDGTVLERDEGLSYGETPTYNGEKPYKAATTEYSYIFKGWTPSVGSVTGNTTYTAVYDSIKIEVLDGCTYKQGDVVIITPSKIKYCNGCGKLINNSIVTITGLRGFLDGTPVYWITYHCCGHKSSESETAIVGKK